MATLLPFLVIIVAFWFLLIRPQQKKQRQVREMQSTLAAGDEVMLTSGILATVADVTDDHILVTIAEGVTVKVIRAAIGQVLPKAPVETEEPQASVSLEKTADTDVTGAAGAQPVTQREENE